MLLGDDPMDHVHMGRPYVESCMSLDRPLHRHVTAEGRSGVGLATGGCLDCGWVAHCKHSIVPKPVMHLSLCCGVEYLIPLDDGVLLASCGCEAAKSDLHGWWSVYLGPGQSTISKV